LLVVLCFSLAANAAALKALIVDGQSNHNWKGTTPVMTKILEQTELFTVDVATSPAKDQSMASFKPDFAKYDVVVLNYTGDDWPKETQDAFVKYVQSGGGIVVVHAANNAFPKWKEYNEITGLGGWGGRNEKSGPYVYFKDGKIVRDTSPGKGGSHGPQHPFQVVIRKQHPTTAGLPEKWMHVKDELYNRLRGPAKNLTVLATAYDDPQQSGTGRHEPILFTIKYGKGRVFQTALGHDAPHMECVGFIVTLQRGAEWAARGKVTQKVPKDFPTATEVRLRKNFMKEKPVVNSGKGSEMAKLQELLEKVKTYDWGQSRLALTEVSDIVKAAFGSPAKLREIEKSLIGVLKSDAKYAGKQFVCRKLSIIGTRQSVPTLAEMLIEPKFSDMARYALERIPDEAVDQALRNALSKTSGKTKVGIINSLGERRDSKAATALSKLIYDSDDMVAGSAVAALGKIGGPRATKALARAKGETSGKLRMLVLDAYLKCADQLAAKGRKKPALAIYKELSEEGLPEPIRAAAALGRLNVIKKRKR